MPGATQFTHTYQFLEEAVERIPLPASSRHLAAIPLRQPGKLLGGASRPTWPAVVLAACGAAGGDPLLGGKVAAAVEIYMAGLDLLDEIEDGDQSPTVEAAGMPQALNIATALLFLAQALLLDLADSIGPARALLMTRTLNDAGLEATGGQHRDLAGERDRAMSFDDALQTARMKAGALMAGACALGALVATDDPALLALYREWGVHYGTAAQLSNDLHDAENSAAKSDIARQKGTLPLLYARADDRDGAADAGPDPAAGGALHFTWVVLEIERQRCDELADQLRALGQASDDLRLLLGSARQP